MICPNCGQDNPDTSKFCSECGAVLKVATRAQAEERKVVSVLFVDLVGFTARSHAADPEDVRAALKPYHELLKREIERFGGTVEKFIGDAVMAVFGAPTAHEDDAERAVRAALRITAAIAELNDSSPDLDLSIRAAVNTGEGLVTLGARPEAGEGMVTGDVVNTASRLQNAAPVGGVIVGEITHRSTADVFDYEALEPVTVKGKPEAVAVWRALSATSRFGVDVELASATPFIGRDYELDLLKGVFRRALRESSVQLVTVTGEPGVGKSRLVSEFFSFIDEQEEIIFWRQGRSLPYGEGITFWALGEIVKAQAGILESDDPTDAGDKLAAAIAAVIQDASERDWFKARLAPLVGAEAGPAGAAAQKEESFTAWRRFLEAIASERPLVVVFEDLHWAEPALLEFIEHTIEWATDVALVVLCTARPELFDSHPGWAGGQRNAATLSLAPLSDHDTAQLLSSLLATAVLPAEVQVALLERAGGNPLYAEEFIAMLSDRGILKQTGRVLAIDSTADIPIPDNVHALIAARLDTLAPERKALLHDASVAGKVFWSEAVAAVGNTDEDEVRKGLHELVRKELIRHQRVSSMEGQQEYSFWHALIKDVSYNQIPRATRGHKHRAMAQWIEAIAAERVSDHADLLVHHYRQSLELARAAGTSDDLPELVSSTRRFLIMAADRALSLDVTKAMSYYQEALSLLGPEDPDRGSVLLNLAKATAASGQLVEAQKMYEEAIDHLVAHGDVRRAGDATTHLSRTLWRLGKTAEAASSLERAIQLLETQAPSDELATAYAGVAITKALSSHTREALTWAERAISLAQEVGSLPPMMEALGFRGAARFETGDPAGIEDLRESLRLGLEAGLGRETAVSYANLVDATAPRKGPGQALELTREGIDFAHRRGLEETRFWLEMIVVEWLYQLGLWDEAMVKADEVIEWSREHEAVQTECQVSCSKALICLWRGRAKEAEELASSFLAQARVIRDLQMLLPSLVIAAVIQQLSGNLSEARIRPGVRGVSSNGCSLPHREPPQRPAGVCRYRSPRRGGKAPWR